MSTLSCCAADGFGFIGFKNCDNCVCGNLRFYDCITGGYREFKAAVRRGEDEPSCVSCLKLWQKWMKWRGNGVSDVSAPILSSDGSQSPATGQDDPGLSDLSGLDLVKRDPGMEVLPAHLHGKQWPVRP